MRADCRPAAISARTRLVVDYVIPDFKELWQPDLTFLSNGWAVAVADIGPELAEMMLLCNAENQRNLLPQSIARFASDMSSGLWRLTHQGIAFNRTGDLHDGQNRLNAVIKSGMNIPFLVFFGAGSDPEMSVIDTGKGRTAIDAAHVMRIEADKGIAATITQAIRYANHSRSYHTTPFTHSSTIALIAKYGEQAKLVHSWFSGAKLRGTDRAPIRAAVLSALVCGVLESKLERFVGVLCDKVSATEDADTAPQHLRNFIANYINGKRGGGVGGMASADLCLRACKAICLAVEGRVCKVLKADERSPFIMPENQ